MYQVQSILQQGSLIKSKISWQWPSVKMTLKQNVCFTSNIVQLAVLRDWIIA